MNISIDSNIIRSDFFFKSKDFQILDDYLERTDSQYVISEVVLQEVKQLFKNELIERIEAWKKSQSSVNKLLPQDISSEIDQVDIDVESEKYMEFLHKTLRLKGSNIIKFKHDYLPELVNRAVKKIMPFKNEDKGFRDTVIWLSLKEHCKTAYEKQIIFISNNPTDFGYTKNKNTLYDTLFTECQQEGIQVNYFNTPKEFIEHHSTKIDFINEDWLTERLSDNDISEMVSEKLKFNDITDWILPKIDMGYGNNIINVELMNAFPIQYLEITIYEMVDNTLIINATIECDAEISIDFHDYNPYEDFDIRGHTYKNVVITVDLSITVEEKEIIETVVDHVS
ncbi:DUF4935 domain-containing protein [Labilibacter sediminis]|nr:DUF4935 domain-containing protein [Labilibacter sediminis]